MSQSIYGVASRRVVLTPQQEAAREAGQWSGVYGSDIDRMGGASDSAAAAGEWAKVYSRDLDNVHDVSAPMSIGSVVGLDTHSMNFSEGATLKHNQTWHPAGDVPLEGGVGRCLPAMGVVSQVLGIPATAPNDTYDPASYRIDYGAN